MIHRRFCCRYQMCPRNFGGQWRNRTSFKLTHRAFIDLYAAMSFSRLRLLVFVVVSLVGIFSDTHAQTTVSITSSGFVPNQVTINVGDSVLWFNYDSNSVHTTTSNLPVGNPDYWNRSLTYFPTSFDFYTRSFVHPGTFNYHDNVSSFTGTIIVNAPLSLQSPRVVNGQFVFDAA